MDLGQFLARDLADHIDQVIDADHLVGTEVERFAVLGSHQTDQAFDAIVHVHVGARLVAIAPDVNLSTVRGFCDLAGDGSGRLLPAAIVGGSGPYTLWKRAIRVSNL